MAARSVYRTLQSADDICDAQRVLAAILRIADDPGTHFSPDSHIHSTLVSISVLS